MSEIQGRNREISRRKPEIPMRGAEMYRVEVIQSEMASAVRLLGGDGSAKEQITRAARATSLPVTVVERLRWKKIKRVPADIADSIREAVTRHNEESLSRAKHELYVAEQRNAALMARLQAVGADLDRP